MYVIGRLHRCQLLVGGVSEGVLLGVGMKVCYS